MKRGKFKEKNLEKIVVAKLALHRTSSRSSSTTTLMVWRAS